MNNILTISRYTFREAMARKIFLTFFAVSSFVLLLFIILFVSTSVEEMASIVSANGQQMFEFAEKIADVFKIAIISPLFVGGLFLSIFSASSFIPSMLEKGTVDLLLSKPISRAQIILGKFFGGFAVVFVNLAYIIIGLWFLLGLKFGVWAPSILLSIVIISFTFAVLYSLIILVGILTRSSILAMMLSYLIFFVLSPVLVFRDKISILLDNKFVEYLLDGLYYLIPKTTELSNINFNLMQGNGIDDYQPLISSFLFMILTLALSIIIFSKKDY